MTLPAAENELLTRRFDQAVDSASDNSPHIYGWDVLSDAYRQGLIQEIDYLGKRDIPLGIMNTEYDVRLSRSVCLNIDYTAQAPVTDLRPSSLEDLIRKQAFYKEYFQVTAAIDEENLALNFAFGTQKLTLKMGVNGGQTKGLKQRFHDFNYAGQLMALGLMMFPIFDDIRERGIVVGDLSHSQLSALALPGKFLKSLGSDLVPSTLDDNTLYVLDPLEDLQLISQLPEDFLKPIRPVGVIFESPKQILITEEDATGAACCSACGQVYPSEAVIAVHNQIFSLGDPECTHCGKAQPIPYITDRT